MRTALSVAWITLAACGRFGVAASANAPPVDAAAAMDGPPAVPPLHRYSLNNSFADDLGGPSLAGIGGVFVAGGYQFAANEGLVLTGGMPALIYSVDLQFKFDSVVGYNKLIDFKNRASDAGLYVFDGQLQFVVIPVTGCPDNDCYTSNIVFADATDVEVTLTRDSANTVAGYVNKKLVFTFADSGSTGAFDTTGSVSNFFEDDTVTGHEAASGIAHRIVIYDVALTPAEVAATD